MDAREIEEDERSLMNLHNNRAGRKVSVFVLGLVSKKGGCIIARLHPR